MLATNMTKEGEDLEQFLRNVDEISEVVKEMSSSDAAHQERALERADCILSGRMKAEEGRTQFNRTVINTSPTVTENVPKYSEMNSEALMKVLEKDAEDRSKRRKENQAVANALKARGNEAFARGDYETAVQLYSEGLQTLRDMEALYTNRAQAFCKLKKYKEAICDCSWALRCNEKSIKAYVHMGRANLGLQNYTEARGCYQKILDIDPGRLTMVKEYLIQVDLEEKKREWEKKALEEFEEGKETAVAVPELLEKLSKPGQIHLYYCGGTQLLSETITDCTGQTLFRLNNGFSIVNGNNIVRRIQRDPLPTSSVSLCSSCGKRFAVKMENQHLLINCPCSKEYFFSLLASGKKTIRGECLELLSLFSQTQHGRMLVIENLDLHVLVEHLLKIISHGDIPEATALTVLENLALEKKFQIQCRGTITTSFVPVVGGLLRNITKTNQKVIPPLLSVMGHVAIDDVIHKELANCPEVWDAFKVAMSVCWEYRDILYALLGLMINLSVNPTPTIQECAAEISSRCVAQLSHHDGGVITRSAGLLSTVLSQSPSATQDAVQAGIVKKMLRLLKGAGQTTTRFAIKTLTVCTAVSHHAPEELVTLDTRLRTLQKLLDSSDEVTAGNAALCLRHCLEVRGAASSLLGSDVVGQLLRRAAGDARQTAVQQNAAIALGKLCSAEPRHIAKLRELHGFEILHSCMKLMA